MSLTDLVLAAHPSEAAIQGRLDRIRQALLARSNSHDLEFLFNAYDREFFDGLCRAALQNRSLIFYFSRRLTKSGGVTRRIRLRNGETSFEVGIASAMLSDNFGERDREVTVCGLPCADRVQALQRIFEHELVHLIENLCWNHSNCSAARFQDIAARLFLHRAHTHNLITRRERAAESGIRPGARVAFLFEGRRLTGQVNRVTQRATVLVEDPAGARYSNGRHYKKYYVPLAGLEPDVV